MASLHLALDADLYSPPSIAPPAGASIRDGWQARAALPPVAAGQLWLVELPELAAALWPQERGLIAAANVVIYDRGLAPLVAGALPLGGYAEPAGFPVRAGDPEGAERCRHFIHDGWSVVRLIDGGRGSAGRDERLRAFAARLRADGADGEAPVQVFVAGNGLYQATTFALDRVSDAAGSDWRGGRVITLFPASRAGAAPSLSAVAANGLAG